ncbi:MAG: YraN family protein [Clostridia bacterium]|nr:YraN family protein [Clostridia bacterium]
MNTISGKQGEDFACEYLQKLGCKIICKNYHSRYGEIDIIASDGEYLAFVEVKTRNLRSKAAPREYVTKTKQGRIIKTALIYLQSHDHDLQPRFDVIEITTDNDADHFTVIDVNRIKNAFYLNWGYSPI